MLDLTPARKKFMLDALEVIDACMHRAGAERDLIKAKKKEIREEMEMKTKTVNKLAKAFHKSDFREEKDLFEEFESIYKLIAPNGV